METRNNSFQRAKTCRILQRHVQFQKKQTMIAKTMNTKSISVFSVVTMEMLFQDTQERI